MMLKSVKGICNAVRLDTTGWHNNMMLMKPSFYQEDFCLYALSPMDDVDVAPHQVQLQNFEVYPYSVVVVPSNQLFKGF